MAGKIEESLLAIWQRKQRQQQIKQHRMKDLYDLTKKLARKKSSTSKPIKDKHGNTLTKQADQLRRWGEYFEELLNQPPPPIPVAIPEAKLMLDVNTAKLGKEEVAKATQNQKNGKAPGPDGISAENSKGRRKHLNADVIQDLC